MRISLSDQQQASSRISCSGCTAVASAGVTVFGVCVRVKFMSRNRSLKFDVYRVGSKSAYQRLLSVGLSV